MDPVIKNSHIGYWLKPKKNSDLDLIFKNKNKYIILKGLILTVKKKQHKQNQYYYYSLVIQFHLFSRYLDILLGD